MGEENGSLVFIGWCGVIYVLISNNFVYLYVSRTTTLDKTVSFSVGKISIELGNIKVETIWHNVLNPTRTMNCQGFLVVDHLPIA